MNCATNYDLKIKKRVQLAHIAANELGLLDPKRHETDTEDEYHVILRRWNRQAPLEAGASKPGQGTRQPVTSSLQMTYQQLGELLDFFKGLGFKLKKSVRSAECGVRNENQRHPSPQPSPPRGEGGWKKYESSINGLKDEICDLAKERWGEAWEQPLNNFCRRFGIARWQWLDVAHGRAVKDAILRLARLSACDAQAGEGAPDKTIRGQAPDAKDD